MWLKRKDTWNWEGGTVKPCLFWFLGGYKYQFFPFPSNDTLSYGKLIALSPYLIVIKTFQNATPHQKAAAIPNLRYSKPQYWAQPQSSNSNEWALMYRECTQQTRYQQLSSENHITEEAAGSRGRRHCGLRRGVCSTSRRKRAQQKKRQGNEKGSI